MQKGVKNMSKEELLALVEKQENQLYQQGEKLQKLSNKVNNQQVYIHQLRQMMFTCKGERFIKPSFNPDQLDLPFEEIQKQAEKEKKPDKEQITYTREKTVKHQGRNKIPEDLPVREVVIEPEECTEGLKKIGEERTEILEYAPARFFKLVLVRPKYEKPLQEGVLIADLPQRPIHKCLAGNMLLSSILVNKFVDHLPLYRQKQIFKRANINIAPSTIDSWVERLADVLEPLYNAMVDVIKYDGYLQADETPIPVQDPNIKGKTHSGYFWVYHSPLKRLVVFDYQKGRSKEAAKPILNSFKGYLQTDGYTAYKQFAEKEDVTHLACWAHARRKFFDAQKEDRKKAEFALLQIQKLYAIEREADEQSFSAEQRKELRLEKAVPILKEFGEWLTIEHPIALPKSQIGKAIAYTQNLWNSLQNYLYDGRLEIDNNLVENSIRPKAIGKKNYLFAGSHTGAKRAAMFYSLFGTCKLNGIDPLKWINGVLEVIANHPMDELHLLFPKKSTE